MSQQLTNYSNDKATRYDEVITEILSVVSGETSAIARYATVACLLNQAFSPTYFWTGFYVVDPFKENELVVGPYQGTLGCLRIPFGRGVCGAAAATGQTQRVQDVHAFPGHIACDNRSNSEIVVPVFDGGGKIAAVLDVDSEQLAAFDEIDHEKLEALCQKLLIV